MKHPVLNPNKFTRISATLFSVAMIAACSSQNLTPESSPSEDFAVKSAAHNVEVADNNRDVSTSEADELYSYGLSQADDNPEITTSNAAETINAAGTTTDSTTTEVTSASTTEGNDMTVLVLDDATAAALEKEYGGANQFAGVEPPQPRVIFYPLEKSNLNQEDMSALKQHADFLSVHPNYQIQIHGHTDASGQATYNERLSEERAQRVADYLLNNGARPEQVEVFGWGSREPLLTSSHHEKNRRVELIYLNDQVAVYGAPQIMEHNSAEVSETF
ncbi:OmpA family protein [Hahella sp. KA22]|uniref:OmpA family protein n=1 Tax=Hahella sp. KA22 TaxID=1628392 RepID=UPI000FDE3D68|nr:OmpA family protein [Hahella sp. KA22]AZZ91112.1 OmpA family protein [Hahella sp. KA22]QAY54481.1 OmpA family protein [Hahella sp. KA22]